LKEYDTSDIIEILIAANELSLQELTTYLQSFLIENEKQWLEQNLDLIYQTILGSNSFLELQKYCADLITQEPDKIFKSTNFSSIPERLLVSIIQNDNLQISEIQVWEHVLKWGLDQNPELPSDVANYSKDDFTILRNTLQQCIPFIKFYNLTSKEFMDKVLPYKKILPKEMYKDLLRFYLSHSDANSKSSVKSEFRITEEINLMTVDSTEEVNLRTVDSKIITYQHAELISKWINRFEIANMSYPPYEFKLLFRGSRDGLSYDKFHEICDKQSRTVTVVKVKDSSEILGGYNPIEWKSDGSYGATKDSFIFSFNNDGIENYILSRVMDEYNATFNGIFNGPSFGNNDLVVLGMSIDFGSYSCCRKNIYEKPIRETEKEFNIEECEVFQIV
jgi:hypothetical protein